jgi:hypothetical protein
LLLDHTQEVFLKRALVSRVGIGKRSLQRIFNESVGVSPKWVIRRDGLPELNANPIMDCESNSQLAAGWHWVARSTLPRTKDPIRASARREVFHARMQPQ